MASSREQRLTAFEGAIILALVEAGAFFGPSQFHIVDSGSDGFPLKWALGMQGKSLNFSISVAILGAFLLALACSSNRVPAGWR